MTVADLEALREKYLTALDAYTSTAEQARRELGEVHPIGNGPVPTVSPAWIQAMEAEHEAQAVYEAARDAYWEAVKAE
ncbi:hypothetical protein ACH40F_29220 [Streptomyces sp. NPDC020794]|uniref:hypothetical protein n=1 Tax=unclassified Streptomyces TaxID=2593676 RepID=UPI0036E39327